MEPTVRRYLDDAPTVDELDDALRRLGMDPRDVARTKEPVAEELDLLRGVKFAPTRFV